MKRLILSLLCIGLLCGCSSGGDNSDDVTPSPSGNESTTTDTSNDSELYNDDEAVKSAEELMKMLQECKFDEAYEYSYGTPLSEDDMPTAFEDIYQLNMSLKEKKKLADYRMNYYNDDEAFENQLMSKIQKVTSKYADKIIKDYKVGVEDGEVVAEVNMMSDDIVAKWFEDIEKDIEKYGESQGEEDIYFGEWRDNVLSTVWKDSYLDDLENRLKDSYKTYHFEFEQDWNDAGTEAKCKIYSVVEDFDTY